MAEEKKREAENVQPEDVRIECQEVCQNHRAITDFRAKFLTLLPLASGTGGFLLLTKRSESLDTTHLGAIGLFGITDRGPFLFLKSLGVGQAVG